MAFRPNMPDHIRRAILSGDTELLRRAGSKGARSRRKKARSEPEQPIDNKSRAAGERVGE